MLMRSFNVKGNLLLNGIMRNIGWIVSNFAIFCMFFVLFFSTSEMQNVHQNHEFVLHFEKRNCSKNGTKEYIASENICVCKSGWETAIDQNPSTRVYCNLYVGSSSTNNSSGTSSSTVSTTEYSVIIIIVIVIIIGVCVCCCCRRPLTQCIQDCCCCACIDSLSFSGFNTQRGACKNCASCQHHSSVPHSSYCTNHPTACHECTHHQPSMQPVYIQQPPSVWMPPSPTSAAFHHRDNIMLSHNYQGVPQDSTAIPMYTKVPATSRKWRNWKTTDTVDHAMPITVYPEHPIAKPNLIPSYSEVTSIESEIQVPKPNRVVTHGDVNLRHSSKKKHEKKDRPSHKIRRQNKET